MSTGFATLRVSQGADYTCVWVEGYPCDWSDTDVQHWAETLAAAGDATAKLACALVGEHWIDLCGWTYDESGARIHKAKRSYVDR